MKPTGNTEKYRKIQKFLEFLEYLKVIRKYTDKFLEFFEV